VKLFETSSEPFLGSLSSNHNFGVTVERFDLLVDEIPTHLEDFFAVHEQENPQLGLPWLQNLSRYSSKEGDTASIFVAYGEGNDLVALPLLISSNREARTLGNFYTSLAAPVTSGSHASSGESSHHRALTAGQAAFSLPCDNRYPEGVWLEWRA
jgi:hypothetical protein